MSSSTKPNLRTLRHRGAKVSLKVSSTIFFNTTVSSIAMAKIFSPFFRPAAFRILAGITTCPLEETLVVDASTTTSPQKSKNNLTYNRSAQQPKTKQKTSSKQATET